MQSTLHTLHEGPPAPAALKDPVVSANDHLVGTHRRRNRACRQIHARRAPYRIVANRRHDAVDRAFVADGVVTRYAGDRIAAGAAVDRAVSADYDDRIALGAASQNIVAAAVDRVRTARAEDRVIAPAAADRISPGSTQQRIVAPAAQNR